MLYVMSIFGLIKKKKNVGVRKTITLKHNKISGYISFFHDHRKYLSGLVTTFIKFNRNIFSPVLQKILKMKTGSNVL